MKSNQEWLSDLARLNVKKKSARKILQIVDSLDLTQPIHHISSDTFLTLGSIYTSKFLGWLIKFVFTEDTSEKYCPRAGFKKYSLNVKNVNIIKELV